MSETRVYLKHFPFWENLTEAEKNYMESHCLIRDYFQGTTILNSLESCIGVVLVLSGSVRAYLLAEDGKEITLFRIQSGDICTLSASCIVKQLTFETQLTAETDCRLLIIPSRVVQRLIASNIHSRCSLYELTADSFSRVMWSMQQMMFNSLESRLAAFLMERSVESGTWDLQITQEEIAKYVNAARETVTRTMKRFSAAGLVEVHRANIIIKDPEGLQKLV